MSIAADPLEGDAIQRRYGAAAAAEWRTLLNQFDLADGFTLIVLVVPDMDGARLCRDELRAWLTGHGRRLEVIEPASPFALHVAAETLFNLPEDPSRGAIWLAAAPGAEVLEPEAWDIAWRHALVGLNQQRNRLRRRVLLPLVLVGNARLVPIMQEIAADLWSVRSLSLRVEPGREALTHTASQEPVREQSAGVSDRAAPDPELALRMADRLRGRNGQESELARALARAGQGLAARGRWPEAEAALRDAANLFEQFGPQLAAVWNWIALGDRFLATRRSEQARNSYAKALAIAARLAAAEPDRADYQRDLSVSYNKMGDLYGALGQGEAAREAYAKSLAIAERLAAAEPDRADYQRDLSVSYNKMGDLYGALGQGEAAREAYAKSLAIAERLAAAEPGRADYQRDLSVSYERMGDLYRALEQGEAAREAYAKSLAITERLAAAEPDRADYQRDLSVSYNKMGDLYRALGQGEAAREAYAKDLAIAERLAAAEPGRADYQRDLAISSERLGDLALQDGDANAASAAYQRSLEIWERLVRAEPQRADLQRGLVVPLTRLAAVTGGDAALAYLQRAASVLEALEREGRLEPRDAGMLPSVRQAIEAARNAAQPKKKRSLWRRSRTPG